MNLAHTTGRRWRRWAGCAVLAGTTACGSPDPATPHWSRLLQGQLDASTQPPCWRVSFPLQLGPDQSALKEPLRLMVQDGLMVERDHIEHVPISRHGSLWVPKPRFELTDKGRRLYRDDLAPAGPDMPRSGLCFQPQA